MEPKSKLELMCEWVKRPFVDKQLDDGVSPNKVADWCTENGFSISTPMMYTYARRRKEAITRGIPIEMVMNKNKHPGMKLESDPTPKAKKKKRAKKKKPHPNAGKSPMTEEAQARMQEQRRLDNLTTPKLRSDYELLDVIMQKGLETMANMDVVAPKDALKALELKHKFTGGAHNGLTIYGVEEIRLREAARESAMTAILLEFIPEDKHEAVLERMEEATKEFYEGLGLGDEYNQMEEAEEA